jgi:hypothetical protein
LWLARAVLLLVLLAAPASAQVFEDVGTRARGMGGAFVALADDATATWWNPAGLAVGPLFTGIVERGFPTDPNQNTALGVAFAVPSLGLSYYRVRIGAVPVPDPAGSVASGRQDQTAAVFLPTFLINQVGATVGQSAGGHLVLASTLRLVHADQTRFDLDIGTMVKFGSLRLGAVLKHVHAPELTVDGTRVGFNRQGRVGVAYAPAPNPALSVNAAFDADLTTTETAFGNARHLAGGAELWVRQRVGLRGGISVNTIDVLRRSFSAGASAAVQKGVFLDARITRGDDEVLEGWGFDLRLTF